MSIIKTLSNSDWYKRLVQPKPHCTCAHTDHLWGPDVTTLKMFDLIEPAQQPRQRIHWYKPQSNILHISVTVCRHWVRNRSRDEHVNTIPTYTYVTSYRRPYCLLYTIHYIQLTHTACDLTDRHQPTIIRTIPAV